MPRFDGTGPSGAGPMTGRGEGYCVVELPEAKRPGRGYVGAGAAPVRAAMHAMRPARWLWTVPWRASAFRRGRAGRGRRLPWG